MKHDTKENGLLALKFETDEDSKFGLMDHFMKVIGRTTKQTEKED